VREGHSASTTNRIAEVAGVSVGTLYQYFANKHEVFDALIRREREAVLRAIEREPLDPRQPLHSTLRRIFGAVLIAMPHGPELFRQLEHVPNALLRRRVAEGKKNLMAFVRGLLEGHRTELRVDDLDLAAFLLVNASEGVGVNASAELWGERLADELTTFFMRYLLNPPSESDGFPDERHPSS